jgi:hypothetical protein
MSDPNASTSSADGVPLSSEFLEFCAKVRKNDPSILPAPANFLRIRHMSEKEDIELAEMLFWKATVSHT